jgi:recombination protein RecR
VGPDQLPLDALKRRIDEQGVREIIVATPLNVEGEATALYVADSLSDLPVKVSRIAAGVPHGGELEFTDQVTLGRALEDRRAVR